MTGKLLIIAGSTASGKTSLGLRLARKLNGEIVSADSRQVYRGMDIGTGKELPANAKVKAKSEKLEVKTENFKALKPHRFENIPVWLLDVVEPDSRFSVADYLECARAVVKDIWRRERLPIVVGGTGFYIKSLLEGVETLGVEPDWDLRNNLQKYKVAKLQSLLRKASFKRWRRMNQSDRQNPRRLIRAIEIISKTENRKPKTENGSLKLKASQILMIDLKANYRFLYQKIDDRVRKRVNQGTEKEIKALLKKGYDWENSVLGSTLGYREWRDFFEMGAGKKEVIQHWQFAEHAYARRQRTWFKKYFAHGSRQFDIQGRDYPENVENFVFKWYYEEDGQKS